MFRSTSLRIAATVASLAVAACAHAPATSDAGRIEGRVVALDTAPWAFDGNGTLSVDTGARTVRVALPARWNLCKGHGLDTVGMLKVGDRVRVSGRTTEDGTLDACTEPSGSIERL